MTDDTKLGRGCGFTFLGLWIALWTVGTTVFLVMIVGGMARQLRALDFATTSGTITSSSVDASQSDDGTSYEFVVAYTYSLRGTPFTGDRWRYGLSPGGKKHADRLVSRFPVGRQVTVYYDPSDPAESLLEPGLIGADLFQLIFLTPFTMVALGSWMFVGWHWRSTRAPEDRPTGVRIHRKATGTEVRFVRRGPILVAMASLLGLSFASIFAVGIPTGMAPSMPFAIATWAVILCLAVGLTIWFATRGDNCRGLEIDTIGRRLTIRGGEANGVTIAFDDIDELRTESDQPGSAASKFESVIHMKPDDGDRRAHYVLHEWSGRKRAQAFEDWLAAHWAD